MCDVFGNWVIGPSKSQKRKTIYNKYLGQCSILFLKYSWPYEPALFIHTQLGILCIHAWRTEVVHKRTPDLICIAVWLCASSCVLFHYPVHLLHVSMCAWREEGLWTCPSWANGNSCRVLLYYNTNEMAIVHSKQIEHIDIKHTRLLPTYAKALFLH